MYIGKIEVKEQEEKNGRIFYKLADGAEGSATKQQFEGMTSEEAKEVDQVTLMISKHLEDVSTILKTVYELDLNYNEAQFVLQRAVMSITELQEQALCKVVEGAFGQSMKRLVDANDISLNELREKVK